MSSAAIMYTCMVQLTLPCPSFSSEENQRLTDELESTIVERDEVTLTSIDTTNVSGFYRLIRFMHPVCAAISSDAHDLSGDLRSIIDNVASTTGIRCS